jgi:4-hydroxy-tetrahydrodipicolinate synthase
MNASTTLRLAEIPNIAGIKEASGEMAQCMEILKGAPKDFLVVSGDDPLVLPQIACGMDGVISVAANAFPKPFSNMVRLSLKGDFKGAKELNDAMMESYNLMFAENNPAGIKAYLSAMGIIENELRLPGVPVASTLQKAIEQNLQVCQKSVAFG